MILLDLMDGTEVRIGDRRNIPQIGHGPTIATITAITEPSDSDPEGKVEIDAGGNAGITSPGWIGAAFYSSAEAFPR